MERVSDSDKQGALKKWGGMENTGVEISRAGRRGGKCNAGVDSR